MNWKIKIVRGFNDMKILNKIETFVNNNSLFFLVIVLFVNFFAVEHSLYTKTIHAVFYVYLLDAGLGMLVAAFTMIRIYQQLKKDFKDEDIQIKLENFKEE